MDITSLVISILSGSIVSVITMLLTRFYSKEHLVLDIDDIMPGAREGDRLEHNVVRILCRNNGISDAMLDRLIIGNRHVDLLSQDIRVSPNETKIIETFYTDIITDEKIGELVATLSSMRLISGRGETHRIKKNTLQKKIKNAKFRKFTKHMMHTKKSSSASSRIVAFFNKLIV